MQIPMNTFKLEWGTWNSRECDGRSLLPLESRDRIPHTNKGGLYRINSWPMQQEEEQMLGDQRIVVKPTGPRRRNKPVTICVTLTSYMREIKFELWRSCDRINDGKNLIQNSEDGIKLYLEETEVDLLIWRALVNRTLKLIKLDRCIGFCCPWSHGLRPKKL